MHCQLKMALLLGYRRQLAYMRSSNLYVFKQCVNSIFCVH
jgi:hypothetical protein